MKTSEKIISEELRERANAVAQEFLLAVRPIYGASEQSEPFHIGSCVLFKVAEYHFLITAAHVIDWSQNTTLYIGGHKSLVPINGECHRTSPVGGNQANDKLDIAFMEIDKETLKEIGSVRFLLPDEIDPNDIGKRGHVYLALGYSNTRNKKLDRYNKRVKLRPYVYSSIPLKSSGIPPKKWTP